MTTEQYLALVDQIGFAPTIARALKAHLRAGDEGARFAVWGTALRKGLVQREGKPLSEGKIVACPCGATYNDATAAMVRLHAGH